MKSFVKILLIIFGALVLLILAAIAVITLVVDPNDYKDRISDTVKARTGRELQIPGDISWSFLPWLGVELGEARLGNAPGFKPRTFAAVQQVEVRVRLWPLLLSELEVGRIVLDGLQLNLQRNAEGVTNWADLLQPGAAASRSTTPEAETSGGPPPLAALAVAGLEIRQARVIWDDRLNDQHLEADPLNLTLGRITLGTPVPLDADFRLHSRNPELTSSGSLSLKLTAYLERQQLVIDDLQLTTDSTSPLIPGERAELQLAAPHLQANLAEQTAGARALTLETFGLQLQSDIQASRILDAPRYQASVAVSPFSPRELLQQLQIALPEMADKNALQQAELNARLKGDLQSLNVEELFAKFDESELGGRISVTNFTRPALTYDLTLNRIDVDRYLPAPVATPAANDSDKAGSTDQAGDAETSPRAEKSADKTVATPAMAVAGPTSLIPVEMIRPLDIEGTLRIEQLKAMNLHSSAIRISARARNGRVRLHPLGAQLYEGSYSGDIRLDVTGNTPHLTLDETLSGVQIGPLLKDLQGDDLLRGQTDLRLNLAARGNEPGAIRRTLSGDSRFEVRDAEIKDIDMAQLQTVVNEIDNDIKAVLDAGNLIEAKTRVDQIQQKFSSIKNPRANNASYFSSVTGTVQFRDGIAHNNDLRARLPFGRIRGEGRVDLVKLHSDYTAFIKLTSKGQVADGATYEQMDKTPFKIHFKGPLDSLTPQPDFSGYLKAESRKALDQAEAKAKAELKKKADEKIEQEKDKLKQKLEEKADDLLKKLFN